MQDGLRVNKASMHFLVPSVDSFFFTMLKGLSWQCWFMAHAWVLFPILDRDGVCSRKKNDVPSLVIRACRLRFCARFSDFIEIVLLMSCCCGIPLRNLSYSQFNSHGAAELRSAAITTREESLKWLFCLSRCNPVATWTCTGYCYIRQGGRLP